MRLRPESLPGAVREVPWLLLAMVGLFAMLLLEHFFVYRQIVLPALDITAEPPLWMWGSLFVPELVVFFAAGWRVRTWAGVAVYALVGASLREGFHLLIVHTFEPSHAVDAIKDPFAELVANWPAIAIAYACVAGLAAWSGRREGELLAGV